MTDNTCVMCGGKNISASEQTDEFVYGVGDAAVTLSAAVKVWSCPDCDFKWTDYEGERARHQAVVEHLGYDPDKCHGGKRQ